jgi:DNA polymerase IV
MDGTPGPPFRWLFTDMNSYFASVEQTLRPELRGKPIAVVPVEAETTAVIAASREAKSRGVKMGTRISDARVLCPDLLLVKARPREYVRVHEELLKSADACAPVNKVFSIDEWAVKLVGDERTPEGAAALAFRIKDRIRADHGPVLTCSIGVAPSRLLAKIASDLQKPDGLTMLTPADLPERVAHLKPQDLCGIGPGMALRLEQQGIRDVRALWNLSRRQSIDIWGSVGGAAWWAGFHGIDEPEQKTRKSSMSHSHVLEPKARNNEDARSMAAKLASRLGVRLRDDGYFAHELSVSASNMRGPGSHASVSLPGVQDTPTLLEQVFSLWDTHAMGRGMPLKVGVVVSGLLHESQMEAPLFEQAARPLDLSKALDTINQRFGSSAIVYGATQTQRRVMEDKIAFGRIPHLEKKVERVAKQTDPPRTNTRRGVV